MSNILAATIEVQQEEIAELREQLAAARLKTDEACKAVQMQFKRNGQLEQRLAAVTDLVPEAELMERVAKYADIAQAHYLQGATSAATHHSHFKQKVADEETLDALADRIRAWRGDGDGREERGGENDGVDL